jgi:hypothetical protein
LNINSPENLQRQKKKLQDSEEQNDSTMEIIDRIDEIIKTIHNARQEKLDGFLTKKKTRDGFERLKQLRESLRSDNKQGLSDEDKQKLETQFTPPRAGLRTNILKKVN